MQTRMYIVTGTAPGWVQACPGLPSSIRARLTGDVLGRGPVEQRAVGGFACPDLSICGPSAARSPRAGGRSVRPREAERGQPGVPPAENVKALVAQTKTASPASSARTWVTYSRITAIGRFGRPTEAQNPGP